MAKRATRGGDQADSEKSIPSPFVVQIDTREQRPYTFKGITGNVSQGSRPIEVRTDRKFIRNGDYSIIGFDGLGIERKSKEDLFGSVAKRENFEQRLARMAELRRCDELAYFAIVVEAELSECLYNPPQHSRLHPKSLNRTILAWRQRYAVDWFFLPGREFAEQYTYRILERFWLDHRSEAAEPALSLEVSNV